MRKRTKWPLTNLASFVLRKCFVQGMQTEGSRRCEVFFSLALAQAHAQSMRLAYRAQYFMRTSCWWGVALLQFTHSERQSRSILPTNVYSLLLDTGCKLALTATQLRLTIVNDALLLSLAALLREGVLFFMSFQLLFESRISWQGKDLRSNKNIVGERRRLNDTVEPHSEYF